MSAGCNVPPCARSGHQSAVQSWAGEVMLLGAVFLTPLDSPEKNPKATFNLWNCTDR